MQALQLQNRIVDADSRQLASLISLKSKLTDRLPSMRLETALSLTAPLCGSRCLLPFQRARLSAL